MAYSGIKERLIRELTEISPLNSTISISTPEGKFPFFVRTLFF